MSKLEALLEAEKRGILPPEKLGMLNEARSRGLIPGGGQESSQQSPSRDLSALSEGERRMLDLQRQSGTPNALRGIPVVGPFMDEIAAGLNAGVEYAGKNVAAAAGYGDGTTFNDAYDRNLTFQRAQQDIERENYPILQPASEVAGAIVGGGAAMGAGRGAGWLMGAPAPAASTAGRVAQAATVGGTQAPVYAFGNAEGGFQERMKNVPAAAAAGVAGGAILGGLAEGAGRIVQAGSSLARPGSGAYRSTLDDLGDGGVDAIANQVATGAAPGNAAMQRQTLDFLGEEMVRANGDAQVAIPATINRIVQETGVSPQAAQARLRRLQDVHGDSDLFFGEYPSVAASDAARRTPAGGTRNPRNVDLDEVKRIEENGLSGNFDYLANSGTGASANMARNAVARRQEQLFDTMRGTLRRISPNQATIDDAENLITDLTTQARREYDAVYRAPTGTAVNNRALHAGIQRVVDRNLNRMRGRSGEQRQALERAINELYVDAGNGQRLLMPSLQMLQDMRGAIRGQIEVARRQGANHLVNTLQPLYRDITGVMTMASPRWAVANRRWADMNFAERATELGDAFAQKAGPQFRNQMREFRQLAPQAQDLVRVHFLQKMIDKVDNLGSQHDVAKLFNSDHIRRTMREMFGDQAAIDFVRAVRDQAVATRTRNSLGNSRTHIRGMVQDAKDADVNLVGSAANANIGSVKEWLTATFVNFLRERKNRPLAGIVTTPMRDTSRVAEHLQRMRTEAAAVERERNRAGRYVAPLGIGVGIGAGNIVDGRRSQ